MDQALSAPGLLRRLGAIVYDSLLVFALFFAATGLYQYVSGLLGLGPISAAVDTGDVITEIQPVAGGIVYRIYLVLVMLLFFVWFWRHNGQTLGMQAWRLRLDDVDGGRVSYGKAALRFCCAWVSALCFGLGYLWVLVDRDKCSWHDGWSGSGLIQLPKPGK